MPNIAAIGASFGNREAKRNNATGGTITTVSNYLGTGDTFRVHTFTSSGTFSVVGAVEAFRVLVVGGGGNGNNSGNPGNGGSRVENLSLSVPVGSHAVTVGARTQSSSLGSLVTASGGASLTQTPGGGGFYSSISGTSVGYAGNGGKIWWNYCCPATEDPPGPGGGTSLYGNGAATYYGGGGAGMQHTAPSGTQFGFQGIVIVAYRVTE